MLSIQICCLLAVIPVQEYASGKPVRHIIVATDGAPVNAQRWVKDLLAVEPSRKIQQTKGGNYVLANARAIAAVSKDLPEFVELRANVQLYRELLARRIEEEFPVSNLSEPSKFQLKKAVAQAIWHKPEQAAIINGGSISLRARQMLSYSCDVLGRVEFSNPGQTPPQSEIMERLARAHAQMADPKGYRERRDKERAARVAIRFSKEEIVDLEPKNRAFTATFITDPMTRYSRSEAEELLAKAIGEARISELASARKEVLKLLKDSDPRTQRSLENAETGSFSESDIEKHKKHYEIHLRDSNINEQTIAKVTRSMKLIGNSVTMIVFVPVQFPDGRVEEISFFCSI
jgi:hypothetical protein